MTERDQSCSLADKESEKPTNCPFDTIMFSRIEYRLREQEHQISELRDDLTNALADLNTTVQELVSATATPEQRILIERIEAANQAEQDAMKQSLRAIGSIIKCNERHFPGQNNRQLNASRQGHTPKRVGQIEHTVLPKIVEWQRLVLIWGEHVRGLQRDYPTQNFERMQESLVLQQDAAKDQIELTAKEVQEGKKQLQQRKGEVGKRRAGKCAIM